MDFKTFDALTRSAVGEAGTRRALLRLLARSALGGVTMWLGVAELTAAKGAKHQHNKQTNAKPGENPQARQRSGDVQTEGKRKHHKKKHPRARCAPGQKRCPDGSCIPDLPYTCCVGQRDCGDEGCYPADTCCPSQIKCPDGSCRHLEPYECCPGQKSCGDEGCIPEDQCCPHERQCGDGSCIREGSPDYQCCPGERECGDEGCFPEDQCCPGQTRCSDGSCVMDECCPDQKRCEGSCLPADQCCPTDPLPDCGHCSFFLCDHGVWACDRWCENGGFQCCETEGICCQRCSDGYCIKT